MTTHTIDLSGVFVVAKGPRNKAWLASVTIDRAAIPASLLANIFDHGLKQLIADSASQAVTEAEAQAFMGKKVDSLLAGEWTQRRGDGGASEEQLVARGIMRKRMRADSQAKDKGKSWKAFTELAAQAQVDKLEVLCAKHEAALAPMIAAELERRAAERADLAALDIDFDI